MLLTLVLPDVVVDAPVVDDPVVAVSDVADPVVVAVVVPSDVTDTVVLGGVAVVAEVVVAIIKHDTIYQYKAQIYLTVDSLYNNTMTHFCHTPYVPSLQSRNN